MIRRLAPFAALALAVSCTAPQTAGDSAPQPEQASDGRCWARETLPAIYEHVMGEVQVVQAEIAEDGTVIRPPIYRRAPVPRVVRPRDEIRFEAPCPSVTTPEFLSSLQRALGVRGYYKGPVTGAMDPATRKAVGTYQRERGLESDQLSLETARALGLVAVDLDTLDEG